MIESVLNGANFRPESARNLVKKLQIGEMLELKHEPFNAYDPSAVQALYEGIHIGYVAKADNAGIAAHMEDGGEVTCEVTGFFSTLKPTLRIELL